MMRPSLARTPVPLLLLAATATVSFTTARAEETCNPDSILGVQVSVLTGPNPRHVLPRDVDEDGILDLVVLESTFESGGIGKVHVFRGTGTGGVWAGGFVPLPAVPVATQSLGVVAEDFDEDGILDLVVTNWGSGSVRFLRGGGSGGVGDGTFVPGPSYVAGFRPYGIAAADFNGDDILDLVVADNGSANVRTLVGGGGGGVGDGTFSVGVVVPVSNLSLSVVTGDFNEDGHADFAATANYDGVVVVALGAGDGTFTTQPYLGGAEPYDLVTADVNQDGITDLVVGNGSHGGCGVMLGGGSGGIGNGTFASPILVGPGLLNVAGTVAADFDGDGLTDLMLLHAVENRVFFAQATAPAVFGTPVEAALGAFPIGIQAADFNNDGRPDVALAEYAGSRATVRLGQCVAPLPPPQPAPILDDVRDVPNDQGGKVFVTWQRSDLDGVSGTTVTGYRVWRRIPPASAEAIRSERPAALVRETRTADPVGTAIVYWEHMATLPAQRLEGYGYTSATTQDSLPDSNPYTAFFITAITDDPDAFYDSAVDSGYSVDNLVPPAPAVFVAQFIPGGLALHWTPSDAPDLAVYHLHRGATPDFVPTLLNRIAVLPDTGYVDPEGSATASYYKLAGVDVHANRGPFALVSPDGPTSTLLAAVEARASADGVELAWFTSDARDAEFRVEHRFGSGDWEPRGAITADGEGLIRFVDHAVAPGLHHYRLAFEHQGIPHVEGAIDVLVPAPRFAFAGPRPNPLRTGEPLELAIRLSGAGRATLEILDVMGRRQHTQDLTGLGPGEHVLSIPVRLRAGLYVVRLREAGTMRRAKLAVVD
jgi:hypothetical protein